MPIVTVDPADFERFDLKTALKDPNDPTDEDGYIMLRPLPYGMKLTRSDKALRMSMRAQGPQDHKKKGEQDQTIDLQTAQEWTAHFDFSYCIGDHNLTDKNKVKIDFTKPMALKLLNPKVGTEISDLIDALNQDEDEESAEDLVRRATSYSENNTTTLDTDSSTSPHLAPVTTDS